jgi:xylan 1,4-beta-xylosidase
MGRPRFPDKSQVRALQLAAVPGFEVGRVRAENGLVNLKFTLSKNEVSLFEICSLVDETSAYEGLDDSKIPGY